MDLDGTLVEANRLSWEACGYTPEQVVGKPFWQGPWWAPSRELSAAIEAATRQAAAGQMFRAEMPYFVADGTERVVDFTIHPIRDETGRVVALTPIGVDITERKRAEAERKRLEDSLKRLALDLSEADRRKNEFLAMLAHELRNPLAPISNTIRALHVVGSDGEALRSASEMLQRQVGQMSRLIDDLLDISRITRGKIELRKQRIDLAADCPAGGGSRPRPVPQHGARADGHAAAAARATARRSRAAGAGRRKSAEQCRQVHGQRRPHLADGAAGRRARRNSGAGHRHRHRRRASRAPVRHVRAGGHVAGAVAGRPGHRPDAGEDPRRAARRERRRPQRRARPRQRVHRAAPRARRRNGRRLTRACRRRAATAPARHGAS